MLQFYSIDLETTGLDSKKHGVTEFAAVFTDVGNSFQSKTFSRWLDPEDYVWSNFCLRLHAKWIDRVTARIQAGAFEATETEPKICKNTAELIHDFKTWLFTECNQPPPKTKLIPMFINGKKMNFDIVEEKWAKITAAGKNFGAFDKGFLEEMDWPPMFRHRSFDPTVLYYLKSHDDVLPELLTCKKRAIAEGCSLFDQEVVAHAALADAFDVAKLIWWRYGDGAVDVDPMY